MHEMFGSYTRTSEQDACIHVQCNGTLLILMPHDTIFTLPVATAEFVLK